MLKNWQFKYYILQLELWHSQLAPALTIITNINQKQTGKKTIMKRSTKHFTKEKWCDSLKSFQSERNNQTQEDSNLDDMVGSLGEIKEHQS